MAGNFQPLDKKFAITDANGQPTDYFIRWAQQRQIDIGEGITLQDLVDYLAAHMIQPGVGIQITPDGNLTNSPTIDADAQAILDEITATRGSILYRGLLGWSALLPGTTGDILKTNGAGADPSWLTPPYVLRVGDTMTGVLTIVGSQLGLTVKDSNASDGFSFYERPTSPGHQLQFVSNAPVTAAGAVIQIFSAAATDANPNVSQFTLFTTNPNQASFVSIQVRAARTGTNDELVFQTAKTGAGAINAGDIVFKPNSVEQFRVITGSGAKVTGTLNTTVAYQTNGTQVVGTRKTGWAADTGTAKRTANATYSGVAEAAYTQATIQTLMNAVRDLSQTVKALKDDLISHGLIGT